MKKSNLDFDNKVLQFLKNAGSSWSDWNVPYEDGETLHELVVKGNYKNILEIGTSTGHSGIWLSWAAAKTGGKVITIEADKGRHIIAKENFSKAGVDPFIEARLGNAREIVPSLKGSFDFVFSDADKDWYLQYFLDLKSKIATGGCFAAHNVLWKDNPDITKFLEYLKQLPDFETHIIKKSSEGISVSCKLA